MASKGGRSSESVKVIVRCRPLNSTEEANGNYRIVEMDGKSGSVTLNRPGSAAEEPKVFSFDRVYDWDSEQAVLFAESAAGIVDSVLQGFNGTIFAYGQTGTGKSHTMEGKESPEELRGVIPRAFHHIFDAITAVANPNKEFLVRASYLEIYNEDVRDLLAKNANQKLELKENQDSGVYVKDLTSYVVKSVRECDKLREFGHKNRKTGATLMNQDSSRSHAIFTVTVEQCETMSDGHASIRMGKLNMVDLAGSERQSKTGATGERLKEATRINLSLSALGNCISALVDGKSSHIPYRDSKLTRMLQDSLGGNTKTVMIANMGPADYNYDETLSTLRYANRAKNIQNKPKINEDPKDAMLREFQEEIARLRDQVARGGGGGSGGSGGPQGHRELVVERVVEKEVVVERVVGISQEEVNRIRQELVAAKEAEKQALLDENLVQREEALRAQAALLEQQERMAAEAQRMQEAEAKLRDLEAKLIGSDGKNIIDAHAAQQEELLRYQAESREREEMEAQRERALQDQQDALLAKEEKYGSLQEEAEAKGRKLKKLYAKYKAAQSEIADLQAEFQREREDMLETVRELTRQLKLKAAVIESFVPPEEQAKIECRAEWDEESEEWRIARVELAGNSMAGGRQQASRHGRRPVSVHAKIANIVNGTNSRYKGENVLSLELEMPERTTQDYEDVLAIGPIKQAIDAALDDSEELSLEGAQNLPSVYFSYDADGTGKKSGKGAAKKKKAAR
mmetsp:Transcript_31643/g.79041  ORF Transcript_31643/g.79041 Transcript_31643/m.79041 type:complete len:742 (-) Transcript_31643:192-2417(-)